MRRDDLATRILWVSVAAGGAYLLYRMFSAPTQPSSGATPATGGPIPAPANSIQQMLATAATNLATGVTGLMS